MIKPLKGIIYVILFFIPTFLLVVLNVKYALIWTGLLAYYVYYVEFFKKIY